MKTSARGWLFAAAGLGAVLLGLAGLVPDWRVRLGLAPAPEVTAGAGGETAAPAQTAAAPAPAPAPAAGDSATGTAEAPAGAAPAETVAAGAAPAETVPAETVPPGAAPAGTAPAEGASAETASTEAASTEAPPAETAATAAVPGDTAAAESAATGPAADADAAPAFDLVRVDPAGEAVIAGTARPGAEVEVLVDGIVVASAVAGGDGSFVALASLGRSDRARALQLRHAGAAQTAAVDAAAVEVVTAAATPQADAGDAAATGAAAGSAVPQGEAVPAEPATAAVAEASAAAAGETPAVDPATAEPAQAALSAPVVILPSPDAAEAPVLVAPAAESVAVLQPAAGESGRVLLDRITYSPGGDAVAAGRARAGHAVRAYANAVFVADAAVAPDGTWQVTLPRAAAEGAHLLRFDEVAANGEVASRLEMPFAYDDGAAPVAARQRQIVVQRGDNLWRIAEQHYGQGLRYSVIFGANAGQIRDPDLIYPGQVFAIPELIATE